MFMAGLSWCLENDKTQGMATCSRCAHFVRHLLYLKKDTDSHTHMHTHHERIFCEVPDFLYIMYFAINK